MCFDNYTREKCVTNVSYNERINLLCAKHCMMTKSICMCSLIFDSLQVESIITRELTRFLDSTTKNGSCL